MIDREQIKQEFADYTKDYDISDEKIKLKVNHTYRVAALCDRIARSLQLSKQDVDLAWTLGMLHDVGRFEQVRIYKTFIDADSVDHAQFGADLLFKDGLIHRYVEDESLYGLIETAIRNHSAYRIADNLTSREQLFCHLLRDADKIDILKVNVESRLEDVYNTTTEQLKTSVVSKEVLEAFSEEHAVLRKIRKTPVDFIVGHISLTYELVYEESLRIVMEQGFLDKLMNFPSDNPATQEQFAYVREKMNDYLVRHGVKR